jgi:vitamin B12 transporter
MKAFLLPFVAAGLCAVAQADVTDLPPVVVTATRSPDIAGTLPNVTVITRADIDSRQPSSLPELLQQEAGITMPASGGSFTTSGIFLRGAAGKQVLVLVDGVRVNDANQGGFDFSLLSPDDIDHIEIVRGPYSAQYGSDAIGGVVQIFTRHSEKADISVRAGSFGTQEYSAGARLGDALDGVSARVGYLDSKGFNATTPDNYSWDPDRDGGLATTAQLSGQAQFGDTVTARFHSNWKESRSEFDIGVNNQRLGTASAEVQQRVTADWTQRLQLGWLYDNLDTDGRSDPYAYFSRFFTQRDSASWLHEVQWLPGWRTLAGIDFSDEKAQSADLLAGSMLFDKQLQNTGVFLTQYGAAGILSGSASLRSDRHDSFGTHGSGSVTLAAQVLPSTRLYAAYGSAFRAPSANDLYYPGFFGSYAGNPDLRPETSREGEFGAEYRNGAQHLRISVWRNRVRDLIAADGNAPFNLVNVNRARLQGVELDAGGKVQRLDYRFNIGSQSLEDGDHNDLPRRPQGTFNAVLGYAPADTLHAGMELRARSSSKDAGQELGGYTLVNVFASWQASPSLDFGMRLENAGDKRYQDIVGYATARRSGYLTARYRWR